MADEQALVMEGILQKKSPKGLIKKAWQSRYFKLKQSSLEYFKKQSDAKSQGEIPLFMVTSVVVPKGKKDGRFDVTVGDSAKVFCLLAKSAEERDLWVEKIHGCMKAAKHKAGGRVTGGGGDPKFWKNASEIKQIREMKLKAMGGTFLKDGGTLKSSERATEFSLHIKSYLRTNSLGSLYVSTNLCVGPSEYLMHAIEKANPKAKEAQLCFHEMREIDHPFVIRQSHSGETTDCLFAMYEPYYTASDTLLCHLNKFKRFEEGVVRNWCNQLVGVLAQVHLQQYCFRNLKPEALWVDVNGNIVVNDPLLCVPPGEMPAELRLQEYDSPEMATKGEDRVSDWWRLGVFMYELAVGVPPFPKGTNSNPASLQFPPFVSASFKDAVQKLLVVDPAKRLGAGPQDALDVCKHPWFSMSGADLEQMANSFYPMPPHPWVLNNILKQWDQESRNRQQFMSDLRKMGCVLEVQVEGVRELPFKPRKEEEKPPITPSKKSSKSLRKDTIREQALKRLFVRCTLDEQQQKTSIQEPANKVTNDSVTWQEEKFTFTKEGKAFDPSSTELIVTLYDSGKGYDEVLGSVTVRLINVFKSQGGVLRGYLPLVDPNEGSTFGEILLSLNVTQEDSSPPQLHQIKRSLVNCYGYTVLNAVSAESFSQHTTQVAADAHDAEVDVDSEEEEKTGSSAVGRMMSSVRGAVSKKKIRFKQDDFDLDLTYITPAVIAMGFPSEGAQAMYRNPLGEVRRFFSTYHKNKFKMYNLCSERRYDASKFQEATGGLANYPFDDHHAPPFKLLLEFCTDVENFLSNHPDAVVAIHCKAGKGRTGTLIACYLIYSGVCETANEALMFFASRRTLDKKGVTIPSQIRYVQYFHRYLKEYMWAMSPRPFPWQGRWLILLRMRLTTIPNFDTGGGCDPYFKIFSAYPQKEVLYDHQKAYNNKVEGFHDKKIKRADLIVKNEAGDQGMPLAGDLHFLLIDHDKMSSDDQMCQFQINTAFVGANYVCLNFNDIDFKIGSSNKKKHFSPDFKVELFFAEVS